VTVREMAAETGIAYHVGPGNGTKFVILERLCLLHFSLADGGAQTSVKKIFPHG